MPERITKKAWRSPDEPPEDCDQRTGVVYFAYQEKENKFSGYGGVCVMVDENGKPLVYDLRNFEQYLERKYWDFVNWENLLWNKFDEE